MKHSIIFTTVIALALSSQLVTAGSITDTYTTGDTLTTTILDNIKTAVNDNDTKINAAKTDTVYITGGDFKPSYVTPGGTTGWFRYDISGNYGFPTTAGTAYITAGVNIPNGAVISAAGCYYYDNNGTYDITNFDVELWETTIGSTFSGTVIATSLNNSTITTSTVSKLAQQTGLSVTVNNATNYYYFLVRMTTPTGYTASISSSIRLHGCRVQYTY